MGNCMRKGSSAEWGGEDWASFDNDDQRGLSSSLLSSSSSSSSSSSLEVKIKISRKELEKVLKEAGVEGLSVQQVLAHLVDSAAEEHRRSWRPALQSIPE